jgi:HD-GYP domain-containing protein (c-di-GMP phosphodiesterase class II)
MLHDVGKSQVPLEILDKPGKLDDGEWKIMRNHPEHSREILLSNQGLDADTVAMAVNHHEKLDGTGYPDGLSGAQISDHVRLTAIADVYSALIDKRSYKEAMGQEEALDLMAKFVGHLDMDLLGAFRSFVLEKA